MFNVEITTQLRTCFVQNKTHQLKKAKMWGLYYKLRTSASFKAQWNTFGVQYIGKSLPVGFCQYVTHEVFKQLIKEELPVNTEETENPLNL